MSSRSTTMSRGGGKRTTRGGGAHHFPAREALLASREVYLKTAPPSAIQTVLRRASGAAHYREFPRGAPIIGNFPNLNEKKATGQTKSHCGWVARLNWH